MKTALPVDSSVTGAGPHADGTVYPLQVVSFEKDVAAVTRSFGPPTRAFRGITHHVLATGASGVVVSASPLAYQLHLWSSSGAPLQTLVRRPAWFADSSSGRVGTPQTPPAPLIQTLGVDRAGYIWVFIRVAATSWQTSWAAVPAGAREVSSRELDDGRLFDTRVEVIDPARGRVVARETVSGLVSAWLGDGEVAVYGASGSDDAVLRVDKLRLTR